MRRRRVRRIHSTTRMNNVMKKNEEMKALSEVRKNIIKDDKMRLKHVSKKINKCIKDKKEKKCQDNIQQILEEFKGINTSSIKSAEKKHSFQK